MDFSQTLWLFPSQTLLAMYQSAKKYAAQDHTDDSDFNDGVIQAGQMRDEIVDQLNQRGIGSDECDLFDGPQG